MVNFSRLKRTCVLFIILGVLFWLFFIILTSILFSLPFWIITSPFWISAYLLIKYTRVSPYIIDFIISQVGTPFSTLWNKLTVFFLFNTEAPKKFLWFHFYDYLCWMYPNYKWKCMNFGYATINRDGKFLKNLSQEDEYERFQLQLYHFTTTLMNTKQNCKDLNILEVGCGRGGGLKYVYNNLQPSKVVGIDYSFQQIEFCQNMYSSIENMSFYQGDADNFASTIVDLEQNSFDLVINVESSHCYGSIPNFVKQVSKVLKEDGAFCITDFRRRSLLPQFEADLQSHDLQIIDKKDITINITQALKLDEKRKTEMIDSMIGFCNLFKPIAKAFSGVEGSRINKGFNDQSNNGIAYVIYVLKKQND